MTQKEMEVFIIELQKETAILKKTLNPVGQSVNPVEDNIDCLSKGKPVIASSEEHLNFVEYITDGKLNTRWAASDRTVPQWVMIDLEDETIIKKIEIKWFRNENRKNKYLIETSNDGIVFQTFADQSKNENIGIALHEVKVKARYVRVTILGTSLGWASIQNIYIF